MGTGVDTGVDTGASTGAFSEFLKLDASHVGGAAEMLGRAFQDDPLYTYFFTDPDLRRRVLPRFYRTIVELMMASGEVYATSDKLEGIFWATSPGGRKRKPGFWMAALRALVRIPGILWAVPLRESMRRFKRFGGAMSTVGPRSEAHKDSWRLNTVAVDVKYRGQKHMSRMVRAVLAEADRTQTCCMLDTESTTNVRIYEHFGFRPSEQIEVVPGELTVYLMKYEPGGLVGAGTGGSLTGG